MANKDFSNVKQYDGKTAPAKKDNTPALIQLLAKNMKAIKSALPKHLTAERVARVALNSIRKNPKLCQCAPETLCMAIMEASSLGLEIDQRGQAYLVSFWNSKTGTYDVQLITGYKGLIDLVYRSGKVSSIMAEVVGENDKFNVTLGLEPKLEHVPNLAGRGEIIAAYAVAIMKEGQKQFTVILREDIDKIRNASKSKDSGPWKDWESEMVKKTVLKRLCKMLPLSPEIQRATALEDAAEAGIAQSLAETVIDIPVQEQPEQPAAIETQTQGNEIEINLAPEPKKEKIQNQEQAPQKEEVKKIDTSYSFQCPLNGEMVTEDKCETCASRKDCAAFLI